MPNNQVSFLSDHYCQANRLKSQPDIHDLDQLITIAQNLPCQYRHITLQEAIWLAEEHYQIEADYEIEEHMDWIQLQNGLREQWLELHRDYRNYQIWD